MTHSPLPEWAIDLRGKLFPDAPPYVNPLPNDQTDAKVVPLHPPAQPSAMAEWKPSDEFMAAYVPKNPIIEPILTHGTVNTLTGVTGTGKTTFMVTASLAVATGKEDMLGLEVEQGRVAYLTCENPDGLRTSLRVACRYFGIDPASLAETLLVQDTFATPEKMLAAAQHHTSSGGFSLIVLDTLQSFFGGDDSNSNAQVMDFLRKVRPLTYISGNPAVVIPAHPIKNLGGKEDLVPYGGGAILNEIDRNLCMYPSEDGESVLLHTVRKLRGVVFNPIAFQIKRDETEPGTVDAKGRLIPMPIMVRAPNYSVQEAQRTEIKGKLGILEILSRTPDCTATSLHTISQTPKGTISKWLKVFTKEKFITQNGLTGGYILTPIGEKMLKNEKAKIPMGGA